MAAATQGVFQRLLHRTSSAADETDAPALPGGVIVSPRKQNGLLFREMVTLHNVLGREGERLLSVAREDPATTEAIADALIIVGDLGVPPAASPNISRRADSRLVSRMGVIKVDTLQEM